MDATLRQVRGLLDLGAVGTLMDAELLERYVSGREEAAFEVLIDRHGPMVLRVCRGVLDDDLHESEDAFQATFLVLARQARSIRRFDSAASWLHGVARRVALKARGRLARRRKHERRAAEMSPEARKTAGDRDDLRILAEEVDRLPTSTREAVVLCYLEGLTYEVAASRLGVPEATIRGRLARARDRLRTRLDRRGMTLPASLGMGQPSAIPSHLVESTAKLATLAEVPAPVAFLAEGVLKTMLLHRIKWTAAVLLAIGIPTTGAIALARRESKPQPKVVTPPAKPAASEPTKLSLGDGQADGKKSLGGSGEMIEFTLPAEGQKVSGIRIHGSRYGQPNPPDESFLVYFLTEDLSEVVATRMAPYSLFERGPESWVDVTFARPVEAPRKFWLALDFRPHQSKGVYVSFDASTGGKHSRTGLPGLKPQAVTFGDWMIELNLTK